MRTASIITGIILAVVASCLAVLAGLALWLGLWAGLGVGVVLAAVVLLTGGLVFQPWQHRWGATDAEVVAAMPGDEVIPGAGVTTRAVTIGARPGQVWPWLAQIGWGRAGWYSYDWLDNDARPSANHVVADLQDLRVGDQILMTPGMGPRVRLLCPGALLVAGDEKGGTWCVSLSAAGPDRTRLVSRWRMAPPRSPLQKIFWSLFIDPGSFLCERKMLKNLRARIPAAASAWNRHTLSR